MQPTRIASDLLETKARIKSYVLSLARHITRFWQTSELMDRVENDLRVAMPHNSGKPIASSSDPLKSDIFLHVDPELDDINRVQASSGTAVASKLLGPGLYEDRGMLPRPPWHTLIWSKRPISGTAISSAQPGKTIRLMRIPAPLLEPFQSLAEAAQKYKTNEELFSVISEQPCRAGTEIIIDYLRYFERQSGKACQEAITGGICVKSPGLATVTVDPETGAFVGLHVDDWYGFPIQRREEAPNRVCINVGCQDRFFLFIDISVSQMHEMVGGSALSELRGQPSGTVIARRFMEMFPSYPALRVRIGPGEAYIAPTENIVHDGSSIEMLAIDVSLSLRGRFALYPNTRFE